MTSRQISIGDLEPTTADERHEWKLSIDDGFKYGCRQPTTKDIRRLLADIDSRDKELKSARVVINTTAELLEEQAKPDDHGDWWKPWHDIRERLYKELDDYFARYPRKGGDAK